MKEESKRIWRYYLERRVPGRACASVREDWLARLAPRLMRYRALIVRRSNEYFDAGCPVEMCEAAAARDFWNAAVGEN